MWTPSGWKASTRRSWCTDKLRLSPKTSILPSRSAGTWNCTLIGARAALTAITYVVLPARRATTFTDVELTPERIVWPSSAGRTAESRLLVCPIACSIAGLTSNALCSGDHVWVK